MDTSINISGSAPPWVSPVQYWLEDRVAEYRVSSRWTLIVLCYAAVGAHIVALVVATYLMAYWIGAWTVATNTSVVFLAVVVGDVLYFLFHRGQRQGEKLKSGEFEWYRDGFRTADLGSTPMYVWIYTEVLRVLLFPGFVMEQAWSYGRKLMRMRDFDANLGARALIMLAESPARVSLYDIEDALHADHLAETLNTLKHLPGVVLRTTDFVALTLNADLRAEVRAAAGLEQGADGR